MPCHSLPFLSRKNAILLLQSHYAGMQKYGIILARQCTLSDGCLLVLGIKKIVEHFFDLMEESIGLLIEEA